MAISLTVSYQEKHDIPVKHKVALLIPVFEHFSFEELPAQAHEYKNVLKEEKFEGKKDQYITFHNGALRVSFVGLGEKKDFHFGLANIPLGNALRKEITSHEKLYIETRELIDATNTSVALFEHAQMIPLSIYTFDKYKSKKEEEKEKSCHVTIIAPTLTDEQKKLVKEGEIIATSVAMARDLCNEPPNVADPEYLAQYIASRGKEFGYSVEIFDDAKIQKLGMNLMYAVGKGSPNKPRFVKISYTGNPSSKEVIALVGKGVAYDTGGVQVKPEFFMNTMKSDMAGAASMFAVTDAIARLGKNINVCTYLPFVQNMVDGNSYLPDDIYTAFNGKTVEIIHTDAEGRLILADALAYACSEKPVEIIDMATLTGASIVALGERYAAVMGTNKKGIEALQHHGVHVDELVWELPLPDEYLDMLKSEVADLTNLHKSRSAGTIIGGLFLKQFVEKDIPWIHMDVASVMRKEKDVGTKTGKMIGFGVQLLVRYLSEKAI